MTGICPGLSREQTECSRQRAVLSCLRAEDSVCPIPYKQRYLQFISSNRFPSVLCQLQSKKKKKVKGPFDTSTQPRDSSLSFIFPACLLELLVLQLSVFSHSSRMLQSCIYWGLWGSFWSCSRRCSEVSSSCHLRSYLYKQILSSI